MPETSSSASSPVGPPPLVSVVHAEPTPYREATLTTTPTTTKHLSYREITSSTAAPLTGYTGRYTQTDPVGLSVGLNLYQYGLGDPLLMTDPLGLRVRVCCKKIILGFRHCYIASDAGATTGLHGTQSLGGYARALFCKDIGTVFGPGSGASDQRGSPRGADFDLDPRIAKQCGDWAEEPCRDPDQCVADVASRYPSPSRYCLFGPNSNTFASFAARQCGIPKPPVAGGFLTPGWNSPPLLPTLPPFPVYPLPAIR